MELTKWLKPLWKQSGGTAIKAAPDERGGNRRAVSWTTAPHLDSTEPRHTCGGLRVAVLRGAERLELSEVRVSIPLVRVLLYSVLMCGRYNLITDAEALIDFFAIEQMLVDTSELDPRYNIAPGQNVPIVRDTGNGRELALVRWGLVPHWSKEEKPKYSTINARAETVAEKPTYREAFKRMRCLIPATGFYEWKLETGLKIPHHIRLAEGGLFAFTGLWDHWDKEGKGFDSCSIIVTSANRAIRPIHDRMPVILNASQYNTWLNTRHYNRAQLNALLSPYVGSLVTYPVSRHVNSPRHDGFQCIEPDFS